MGCEQSVPVDSGHRKPIQGVGQTERLVGRAERLTKGRNVNNSDSKRVLHPTSSMVGKPDSTSSTASSQGSSMFVTHLPKLDPTGRLLPEEVVRRTNGSIVTHTIVLGTAENPLQVEVRCSLVRFFLVQFGVVFVCLLCFGETLAHTVMCAPIAFSNLRLVFSCSF
jgi:hypothetical protein